MIEKIKVRHIQFMGYLSCYASIMLWLLLIWNEPYFDGMNSLRLFHSVTMILLPSLLFLIGLYTSKVLLMILALLWGIPYAVYMLITSSIYMLFGFISLLYLVCIILLRLKSVKYW